MQTKIKLPEKNIIFIFLIIMILIITGFFMYKKLKADDYMLKIENNEYIAILFNIYEEETLEFSELLIYDPDTKKTAIFNIPGNYGSIIESLSKIERLGILFDNKKPGKIIEKIESITTLSIDYYLNIEKENLGKITDLLSGLEIFIANPVEKLDSDEIVLLPSGSNILDGEKIQTFLFEHSYDEGDVDIISKWHKFIQSFLKTAGEKSIYLSNPIIQNKMYSYFTTDMRKDAFKTFLAQIKYLDGERMILQRILGEKRNIDGKQLLFPYHNGTLLKEAIKQTLISLASENIISDEEINIGIEILNGTAIPGLAGRTSHYFTNLGYDVLFTGNANENNYEKTVIISNGSDPALAQKIANIINCNNIETTTPKEEFDDSSDYIEDGGESFQLKKTAQVSIILGKDFDGRYCR